MRTHSASLKRGFIGNILLSPDFLGPEFMLSFKKVLEAEMKEVIIVTHIITFCIILCVSLYCLIVVHVVISITMFTEQKK